MTLFGTTLDGQQIISLVSLLLVLVFWILVLKRQRRGDRDLADRLASIRPPTEPKPGPEEKSPSDPPRAPWG